MPRCSLGSCNEAGPYAFALNIVLAVCGMIDMYGWLIPEIDRFDLEINLPIVNLMHEIVKCALSIKETYKTWFEKVEALHYFDK